MGPNRVNYHMEHHLLITVPHYNLPRFHELLVERGLIGERCVERGGYRSVLRRAASKPESEAQAVDEAEPDTGEAPRIPPF